MPPPLETWTLILWCNDKRTVRASRSSCECKLVVLRCCHASSMLGWRTATHCDGAVLSAFYFLRYSCYKINSLTVTNSVPSGSRIIAWVIFFKKCDGFFGYFICIFIGSAIEVCSVIYTSLDLGRSCYSEYSVLKFRPHYSAIVCACNDLDEKQFWPFCAQLLKYGIWKRS